ncbi:MAG: pantoate--beta-alanine ligase, partial [Bacteroidota bacterium]
SIGFVPTMGALHEGHISLIRQAQHLNELVVVSIFVNPTQFNEKGDLDAYPRTPYKDIDALVKVGCDVLFMPTVDEVYPKDLNPELNIDFGKLDKVLEGAFRPGHFKGVAQVVKRLLDIVQPNDLIMGQKDFQQWSIINSMIKQLNLTVKLQMGETVREQDGLAMSSRNVRLSADNRIKAPLIHQTLSAIKSQINSKSIAELKQWAVSQLDLEGFRLEYIDIIDGITLLPIQAVEKHELVVVCIAIWAGEVRLIDNLIIKK